jgi:hypothetical protein
MKDELSRTISMPMEQQSAFFQDVDKKIRSCRKKDENAADAG